MQHNFNLREIILFSVSLTTCSTLACYIPDKFCNNDDYGTLSLEPASVYSECGDTITKTEVKSKPSVQFSEAEQDSKYLLIMVDPDAPSPENPTLRYWLHWLVVNITGESLRDGGQLKGQTLVDYNGPSPPKENELHRYQFLLVKDRGTKNYDNLLVNGKSRGKFDVAKFLISTESCNNIAALYEYRYQSE